MGQAVSGVRFGTTRLATGPQLHYAERGDPDGQAILFIHGWPDSWFSFSRVLPLLPERYHAFAFDQRGFGDSERPDCGYGIDDLASDAAAFLDAVSVERATVVGHSLGSFVARRVAVAHPERVARLVLIGSGVSAANKVTREVQANIQNLTDPVPTEFARGFQASTVHVPIPEQFFEGIVAESLKLPARLWRDVCNGLLAFNDVEQLGRIAAPALLIWGERDALFPRDDQDRLVTAIPNARLRIYPDTGHCPNWERPEQVVADLDAFMQGA
jgi:non-heme chloroperoxidase